MDGIDRQRKGEEDGWNVFSLTGTFSQAVVLFLSVGRSLVWR